MMNLVLPPSMRRGRGGGRGSEKWRECAILNLRSLVACFLVSFVYGVGERRLLVGDGELDSFRVDKTQLVAVDEDRNASRRDDGGG